jgi:hypothetical protein
MSNTRSTTTTSLWSGKKDLFSISKKTPFFVLLFKSMILHDDHLYILCGTNSWIYNSDVYDIYLPELKCQHIGSTFDEIEDPSETGR